LPVATEIQGRGETKRQGSDPENIVVHEGIPERRLQTKRKMREKRK